MSNQLAYISLRLWIGLMWILPFPAVHILADVMAFVLYQVVGYRKHVVLDNLKRAFPQKSEDEIRHIARLSYQNLADITLETFKFMTLPMQEAHLRCRYLNPEDINVHLRQGRSVILSGSHYTNWEACFTLPLGFEGATATAYKPLTNKVIDRYLNHCRSRAGMEMISMNDTFAQMRRRQEHPTVYILLADQSPSSSKSAHWVDFLGQDTASLPGVDVLARKFNYPVFYLHVERLRRGYYEARYDLLWEDPTTAREGDITRAFARHAEAIIRAKPEGWLWSHKRWKIKRTT